MSPRARSWLAISTLGLALGAGCATVEPAPAPAVVEPPKVVSIPEPLADEVPEPSAEAARTPAGYRAEVVLSGLTYPSSVEFDERGTMFVAEAGMIYGDDAAPLRILAIEPGGRMRVLVEEGLQAPITDLLWHDGALLVSHRGKISRLEGERLVDLITDLPSFGDHQNGQLVAGPDGLLYFGQGTATNSGVVGVDNYDAGWLRTHPNLHDVPPRDLQLRDVEYASMNPLARTLEEQLLVARTPAFQPFNSGSPPDEVEGRTKANGTILRFDPERPEETLEVYAWGFRNPFGLAFAPSGHLFASDNGMDDRGSRPVVDAPDSVWRVERGRWYGWPDFASGLPVTDARFASPEGERPEPLLDEHPRVEQPYLRVPSHTGVAKLELVPEGAPFGRPGLYLAAFGDLAPRTGQVDRPVGRAVLWIDPERPHAGLFFRARPQGPTEPATDLAGPRRPVDVRLDPQQEALYVVDMGALVVTDTPTPVQKPFHGTGVVWRITRADAPRTDRPPANLTLKASLHRAGEAP